MLSSMKRSLQGVALFAVLLFSGSAALLQAQTTTIKAEVWDVRGPATFTVGTATPRPIETGTIIPAGAVVKTGLGAALDADHRRPSFHTLETSATAFAFSSSTGNLG